MKSRRKEKETGDLRGGSAEVKRGKKNTRIRIPFVGAHFKSKVLEFLKRVRIKKRWGDPR